MSIIQTFPGNKQFFKLNKRTTELIGVLQYTYCQAYEQNVIHKKSLNLFKFMRTWNTITLD